MTDWNAVSAFMGTVVPWPGDENSPGYVNLHYDMPPDPKFKGKGVPGWPFRTVDDFTSRTGWALGQTAKFRNIWFCTSLQAHKGTNKNNKPKAIRRAENAIKLKAIWIDCDVKPNDLEGKHYTSDDEALTALLGFVADVGLPPPSAIVHSGGGFHLYWISNKELSPDEWFPYASGLKQLLLEKGIKCDTGLTTDRARLLRVPGTLNYKYDPPRPVRLLSQSIVPYDFVSLDFLRAHAGKTPITKAPVASVFADGVTAATFGKPIAIFAQLLKTEPPLSAGITGYDDTPLDPLPIFQQCKFMSNALETGGADYDQPLWMYSILAATFLERGNVFAHAMSQSHRAYSPDDTQAMFDRKLAERADRGIGYPSCAAIAGAGCKACAQCPLFEKGKSPLNIRELTVTTSTGASAAVQGGIVDDPSFWMPDGYELDGKGIICKRITEKDEDGGETEILFPLFKAVLSRFWLEKGDQGEKLNYTVSVDKGHTEQIGVPMGKISKMDFRGWLGEQRVLINAYAQPRWLEDFHLSTIGRLRELAAAQTSVPFGWYEEHGVRRGFVFGGKIMLDDGSERPCGSVDMNIGRNYAPLGSFDEWMKLVKVVTDRKRPELNAIWLVAFMSPLLPLVGRNTIMMSAWGSDSGAGKSSSYQVGTSVWGHPVKTKGTPTQTANNITTILKTTRNLPYYWEEITTDEQREKIAVLMHEVDGGKEKGRNLSGTATQAVGTWALALHYAANQSFLSFLRRRNSETVASVSRVLEYEVKRVDGGPGFMPDAEATTILDQMTRHYGVMGMKYARYLADNHKRIADECRDEINKVQHTVAGGNTERYWYTGVGLMICAARYAKALGMDVDVDDIEKFMYKVYLENLDQRNDMYSSNGNSVDNSETALTRYLKERDAQERGVWTNYIHNQKGKPPKPVTILKGPSQQKNTQGGIEFRFAIENKLLIISRRDFSKWLEHNKFADVQIYAGLKKVYNSTFQRLNITSGWLHNPGREEAIVLEITPTSPLWDYMLNYVPPEEKKALLDGEPPLAETGLEPEPANAA